MRVEEQSLNLLVKSYYKGGKFYVFGIDHDGITVLKWIRDNNIKTATHEFNSEWRALDKHPNLKRMVQDTIPVLKLWFRSREEGMAFKLAWA